MAQQFTPSQPLATAQSLTSTRSSSEEADRAKHLKYAYDRADRILRFYRRNDAWDPDVFLAGIAANLAEYPKDIIDEVADPVRGIASKCTFPPQPAEVRKACEAIAVPRRQQVERQARIRAQLERRAQIEAAPRIRQTPEEIKAEMIARGFNWGGRRKQGIETPESVRAKFGLTQEQWDALPDGPKSDWQQSQVRADPATMGISTGPPDRVDGTLCTEGDLQEFAKG